MDSSKPSFIDHIAACPRQHNPASFDLDLATYLAACYPEDRNQQYWNEMHTYVRCTKIAQSHERFFLKTAADARNAQENAESIAALSSDDTPAPDSDGCDTSELDSIESTPKAGSFASVQPSDFAVPEPSSDEHVLASGGGEAAPELRRDGNPSSSDKGNDEATAAGSWVDKSTRPAISCQRLEELRLLRTGSVHARLRLARASLEVSLLQKEVQFLDKRLSDACAVSDISKDDPLITALHGPRPHLLSPSRSSHTPH